MANPLSKLEKTLIIGGLAVMASFATLGLSGPAITPPQRSHYATIEEFDEASQRQQRYSNIGVLGTLAGALITAAGVALYDLKSS